MTQSYQNIPATQTLQTSRQLILDRDDAAASNFSGTAFPTTNLLVGMLCHRTDLGKVYSISQLDISVVGGGSPVITATWVEVFDVSGTTGLAPRATKLATSRNFSLAGDVTAPTVGFDGTGVVVLAATLAASGVTAGTYTKVTVDAKGRVTGGAVLAAGDLPTALTPNTVTLPNAAISLTSTVNPIQIGSTTATNMVFDNNDIQVRNNSAAAGLRINIFGGDVTIGDGVTTTIKLDGDLNTGSLIIATQAEAEAGTVTSKLMTPLQTAQAIAEKAAKAPSYQAFTASGTWTKPAGYSDDTLVTVEAWGAGGGGGVNSGSNSSGSGGGGGCYSIRRFRLGDLAATVAVSIGAGGVTGGIAGNGGNTTFGTLLTAYGGEGGVGSGSSTGATAGGNGGGPTGVGLGIYTDYFSGAAGGRYNFAGGNAAMGGAGGGGANSSSAGAYYAGGTSMGGGNGGFGGRGGPAVAGSAPGGGGGGAADSGAVGANGARGELRIYIG